MSELSVAVSQVRRSLSLASAGLIQREVVVDLVALCAVAGEHLLVIGPPGTAKSEAVRRVAAVLGGRYFEYLLGRFTEPSEIFGPVDLRKLKDGIVETQVDGMLPEADVAFLDEVFLGSTAILNTLLGLLNERTFRRGHTALKVPLRVCVGAANQLPHDESLAAFADRFLARVFVEPVPDARLEDLLQGGASLWSSDMTPQASLASLDVLHATTAQADLSLVRPSFAHAVRLLRQAGVQLSDRRAVKAQRLVAAAGVMAGRTRPTEADLWPLLYTVPTHDAQRIARDALRDLLATSENQSLPAAAEDASNGPMARATRLTEAGNALLASAPAATDTAVAREAWALKLEGVARELDAGFSKAALPPQLAEVRARIVEALRSPAPVSSTP